jgi:ABC-type multidrug transport system fused ATPase/permease subunit
MRSHTTTTHSWTYVRVAFGLLCAALLSLYVPYIGNESLDQFLFSSAVNIGILYAMVVGFLMMIVINRKQALDAAISLELNKLRRIYHLAKHLAHGKPGGAAWFKKLEKALMDYLKAFGTRDFLAYDEGNALHRKITYAVYAFPDAVEGYSPELYASLLDAAAEVTEAREHLRSLKDASIGYFQWVVTMSMTIIFGLLVVIDSQMMVLTRLISFAILFNLSLMVQLIYEYDQMNPKKRRFYANLYQENAKHLK